MTNAKDWIRRSYRNPERVNIRSEMYLVDADVYLSRGSSALARGDFQSATVFSSLALECVLKIVVEAGSLPFSQSRFVHVLEESTEKLGCQRFFDAFLDVSRLRSASQKDAEQTLTYFQIVWDYVASLLQEQASMLDLIPYKVKNSLNYCGNPAFLKGMTARAQGMIDAGEIQQTCHYVRRTLVDILENYAYFAASLEGFRLNYALLFKSLKTLKDVPAKLYGNVVAAFDLQDVGSKEAVTTVEKAKKTILDVRRSRSKLIHS